jgi:hypothetical protein
MEEHGLGMFQDKARLLTVLGPKRKEVTGRWRKLRDEELYFLYSSANTCN